MLLKVKRFVSAVAIEMQESYHKLSLSAEEVL